MRLSGNRGFVSATR